MYLFKLYCVSLDSADEQKQHREPSHNPQEYMQYKSSKTRQGFIMLHKIPLHNTNNGGNGPAMHGNWKSEQYSYKDWAASLLVAFDETSSFACQENFPCEQPLRWLPANLYSIIAHRNLSFFVTPVCQFIYTTMISY